MNYRTLAKGALALSLGLIVGSAMATTTTTDVQKYGATFESTTSAVAPMNDYAYEVGTNVTKYAVTGGNPSGWFGAAEDESKIIAAHGGQALQLNTDAGTLTNKLESSIATQVNAGIAAAGAYIETEAKFVASDTLDAGVRGGTDDTKFAIYAYADENANPCTTNLVVYHAFPDENADGGIAFTNEIFNTLINCDDYTKLRVTMKKIDIGEGVEGNVFSVSINNGEPLASPLAIDAALEEKPTGIWFLTVEKSENDNNTLLSSVNFKGTGEVDNLAVGIIQETTTYAVDWTGSANVVVSNATDALSGTTATVAPDTVITFYPTEGTITNVNGAAVANLASYPVTVNSDTNVIVLAGFSYFPRTATAGQDGTAEHPFELADADDLQALKDAFAADPAWRSKNYKLVDDIDATDLGYWDGIGVQGTANSGLNGTLDGDGHIITNLMFSAGKYRAFFNRMDNATIKNLTIHVKDFQETDAEEHGYAAFAGNMNSSKLVNCTATGTIGTTAKPAMHTSAGFAVKTDGGAVFVNCTNHIDIVCALNDNPKVGGIIGLAQGVSITNCWNDGDITIAVNGCNNAANGAGGLVGYAQSKALTIYGSGNAGTVQSTSDFPSHASNIPIKIGTIIGLQQSSSATVSGGTIAQADAAPAGARANITGLDFATVDNNVATFVPTLESNNTYKVMLDGATATYAFAAPGTISFDTAMYTPTFAITAAEGLDLSDATDGTVKTYTATAPTPTYTVSWAGSENVVVSNTTAGAEILVTTGEFEENTVITFYPTIGSITNVLLNGVEQRYETPFAYTVTTAADQVLHVYAGEEPTPAGYNYPEGGSISDAAVVSWLTTKGFTQAQVTALGTNAKFNECYLLNCDISQSDAGGSIAITAIAVTGSGVTVTVELDRTAGYTGGINGTLKLYGTADLGTAFAELDSATVTDADFSEGDTTTATLSGGTAKFFKAVIE